MSLAGTLDLKAEKRSADPDGISSVQFSPDGSQIVSGGYSGTIKIWDAGARFSQLPPCTRKTSYPSLAGTLELKGEKTNAHDLQINSVAFSPDGTKIVSACAGTIKVWKLGTKKSWFGCTKSE